MESNQVRKIFTDLRAVHEDREQYKLEWAYKHAQEEMDVFRSNVLNQEFQQQCWQCGKKKEAMKKYQALMQDSYSIRKKSKWYKRFFHNIYSILTLVEVGVSFSLVFLLSQLSHMGGSLIHSQGLSILFAMTFAFLKVVLERYYVEPRMNEWGWKVYIDSVDRLDQMTMELIQVANGEESLTVHTIPLGVMGNMRQVMRRQLINNM
jgi:hypothetical protein